MYNFTPKKKKKKKQQINITQRFVEFEQGIF